MLHETLMLVEQNQWPMQIASESSKSSYGAPPLPLVIRVTGVTRKQRQQQDWYSNGFLTNSGSYKLRLMVGNTSTHMGVYTEMMPGPKDHFLPWLMWGKFTVELLNQLCDGDHYKRIWVYDSSTLPSAASRVRQGDRRHCWGTSNLISLSRLQSVTTRCQYLKDNCIYFRVSYQRM